MRFSRILLDRYGHLTGMSLDLPDRSPDLHIFLGANEAGKSTAQAALTDLLFGFGHRTAFDFLHEPRDLRVGADLVNRAASLSAWRRKARSRSLQTEDGAALDDSALDPFLAGVDRDTFLQQFSLNHVRLREGGEAILEAGNDLGRMLFQAGAGIDWLGDRLRRLEAECAELFKPAGHKQAVAEALRRREEALRRKREAAASDRSFREVRKAERQTAEELAARMDKRQELVTARSILERARRVIPTLRKIDLLQAEIAAAGPIPALPDGIRRAVHEALEAHKAAEAALAAAGRERRQAEQTRDALSADEAILARAEEIERLLGPPRSRYLTAAEDLPRRQFDLEVQESLIAEKGRDVGQPTLSADSVAERLPTRQQMAALRRLAGERREHYQAVRHALEALEKVRSELAASQNALAAFGDAPDPAPLKEAVDAAAAEPGLETRIGDAAARATGLRDDIAKRTARMVPEPPAGVVRKTLPATAVVTQFAEDLAAVDRRLAEAAEEDRRLEGRRADIEVDRDRLLAAGAAVPADRLTAVREQRDRGWQLLRRRYIDGGALDTMAEASFAGDQTLANAFAAAIGEADAVADARFAAAETSGKLAARDADLAALDNRRTALAATIGHETETRRALIDRWQALWTDSAVSPAAPAAMADWLADLEAIEGLGIDLGRLEGELAREQARAGHLLSRLVAALAGLAIAAPDGTVGLTRALALAQEHLRQIEAAARDRRAEAERVKALSEQAAQAARRLARARSDVETWQTDWTARLAEWSLPADTDPADVEPILDAWEIIRAAHDKIAGEQGLRHRIATMCQDRDRFVGSLHELVAAIAADLADRPPLQAAHALERRLGRARSDRELKEAAVRQVEARSQAETAAAETERQTRRTLDELLGRIGADDMTAAGPLLDRAESGARLLSGLAELQEALKSDGEGLSEEELRRQCRELDFDSLPGQIATLKDEDAAIVQEIQRLSNIQGEYRQEFGRFLSAGAGAADAAEDAERASTDALRAAERYIRLKTTAGLLRHAIDRYRKDNEGPLLGRASALFRRLTVARYAGLEIDHESGERPLLMARQVARQAAGGARAVPVEGLSDGTRDQLFLALRLAGIQELLDKGTVLPFVADDLFINFDDERAVAGLEVLAEFAARTQVLFFTHHRHLVDVANQHIAERFNLVTLNG